MSRTQTHSCLLGPREVLWTCVKDTEDQPLTQSLAVGCHDCCSIKAEPRVLSAWSLKLGQDNRALGPLLSPELGSLLPASARSLLRSPQSEVAQTVPQGAAVTPFQQ